MIEWVLSHQYIKRIKVRWFHRAESGKLIRPGEKAVLHVIPLPGVWQKDKVKWYTEKEWAEIEIKYGKIMKERQ